MDHSYQIPHGFEEQVSCSPKRQLLTPIPNLLMRNSSSARIFRRCFINQSSVKKFRNSLRRKWTSTFHERHLEPKFQHMKVCSELSVTKSLILKNRKTL
jgi:phage FluMu gp28-like protein